MRKLSSLKIAFSCIVIFLLASCRKDELPVPKPQSSGLTTSNVNTSSTYEHQMYFDLSSGTNAGQSHKTDWDLAFSCNGDTPYILLNTSKIMMAQRIQNTTFEQLTDTTGFATSALVDYPSGALDSLALAQGSLFLIDRGFDASGNNMGMIKMEIIEHTTSIFKGKFANVNGSNEQTIEIQKNNDYNYVYIKWFQNSAITTPTVEPLKTDWDLHFTQYTEVFHEPSYMPYSVMGVLLNNYQTSAILETTKPFDEIDLTFAENLNLSTKRNAIGYDWKSFQFQTNLYVVDYTKVYVIKDSEGFFYKLRFVDFYSAIGEKGAPLFEYQRL